jgi:hypothetical protein
MKNALIFILFALTASQVSAQYDQSDLLDAGESMDKFVKAKYTAMGLIYGGSVLTTVGALTTKVTVYPNGATQREYSPFIFIGPAVSLIGIIVDKASYRHLSRCALYLKQADTGMGVSVGLRF